MIADEVLKRDEERRRRRDEGEKEDEAMEAEPTAAVAEDVKPRVVAKTRVSLIKATLDDQLTGQLRFTDSEVAEMKSMGVPPRESDIMIVLISEIKILGFQSADLLQIDENIKHSYFIYPDENVSFRFRVPADY